MSTFDRIRPRDANAVPTPTPNILGDTDPRRAFFSTEVPVPALGSVAIECSACKATSVVGMRAALRAAFPSVHLPFIKKDHSSWMQCPACHEHTWVKLSIRL